MNAAPRWSGPQETAGLVLRSQPTREGDDLVFPYTFHNVSSSAVWVMESVAGRAGSGPIYCGIAAAGGDEAVVGRLLPPLPADRTILFALTPLARRLEAGASLTASLRAALPLVESSAYLPDLPVRQHTIVELTAIRLMVAAWPAQLPGLAALPVNDGPALHRLAGPDLRAAMQLAEARFPVRRLHMLRRSDAFLRDL